MSRIDIVFPFIGAGIGGSHISTLALAEELRQRKGYRCLFISPGDTPFFTELKRRAFEVAESPDPASESWPASRDLVRALPRRDFLKNLDVGPHAIMHCNDLPTLRSWGFPARTLSIPIVYHHRSINRMTPRAKLALSWVDHTICNSAGTLVNIAFIPAWRRSRIWNPISIDCDIEQVRLQRIALRKELGLEPYNQVVGFAGNFWKRKRPFFFVDVAREMLALHPTIHFVIYGRAGDVTERELSAYIDASGLTGSVTPLGFRSPPECNIAALDLLLAPAIDEPFGRTLVEALLIGVPYVATDDAGHREIWDKWGGGALVPKAADAQTFSEAALTALAHPIPLDRAARQGIVMELSAANHADNVIAVYSRTTRPPKSISQINILTALRHDSDDRLPL